METSEVGLVEYELMELSDEDLLVVSGGATVSIQGPNVHFGGTVGGGSTVVAVNGTVTANASATGLSFGGATAAGGIVITL